MAAQRLIRAWREMVGRLREARWLIGGAIFSLAVLSWGNARAVCPDARVLPADSVLAVQLEEESPERGRYDWGASVMKDGDVYRMWWVRLGGDRDRKFKRSVPLRDGSLFELEYPDFGDRIFHAESRDGRVWDFDGAAAVLGPAESAQEINHVGTPTVIKVGEVFYMYYEAPAEFAMHQDEDGKVTGCHEYQNQVFLATSGDGRSWTKYPANEDPQPVVAAPASNLEPGRQRYGLGQPSACYRDGKYILHYVDSCTGPGDFIVRLEADNPQMRDAKPFSPKLDAAGAPEGAVARFAQTDVSYLAARGDFRHKLLCDLWALIRPAYGTGNLGLLTSRTGVFKSDAAAESPKNVFPQIAIEDPRGKDYTERLFPAFLTTPEGEILVENGRLVIFYGSGRGWKESAHTWDIHRCEVAVKEFE